MVRTYANRVLGLKENFKTEHRSIINKNEIETVRKFLGLNELKTELELRNMRDMVVLIYNQDIDDAIVRNDSKVARDIADLLSAVVAVIDKELYIKGYEA